MTLGDIRKQYKDLPDDTKIEVDLLPIKANLSKFGDCADPIGDDHQKVVEPVIVLIVS